jgi:hypothetical protein
MFQLNVAALVATQFLEIPKAKDVIYDADRQYGEIAKDKILWSNGTWWSRQPAKYAAEQKVAGKEVPRFSPGNLTD